MAYRVVNQHALTKSNRYPSGTKTGSPEVYNVLPQCPHLGWTCRIREILDRDDGHHGVTRTLSKSTNDKFFGNPIDACEMEAYVAVYSVTSPHPLILDH